MRKLRLDPVYPISTAQSAHGLGHLELAQCYLDAGVRLFQVRDKLLNDSDFYHELLQIKELTRGSQACFLVNDRIDLTLASGAAGTHLGQTDLPVEVARRILGREAFIGISTHTQEQFLKAQTKNVDYVALGPVFSSSSKVSEYAPLGLDFLREMSKHRQHPLVAIGGINLENVSQVWGAGADSVAVISDIADCPNPTVRIRAYLDRWAQC